MFSCCSNGSLELLHTTFSNIKSFGVIIFQIIYMQKLIGHLQKLFLNQKNRFFYGKHFLYYTENMCKIYYRTKMFEFYD